MNMAYLMTGDAPTEEHGAVDLQFLLLLRLLVSSAAPPSPLTRSRTQDARSSSGYSPRRRAGAARPCLTDGVAASRRARVGRRAAEQTARAAAGRVGDVAAPRRPGAEDGSGGRS